MLKQHSRVFYFMDKELSRDIIIIALDNLIKTYSELLEIEENKENKEFFEYAINLASSVLSEISFKAKNQKPEWEKLYPN